MKRITHDNRGLSLVEILGALVILGILLVAFFTFFTQSAKFTSHNYEKLTAVQVAEDVVGIIRSTKEFPEDCSIVETENQRSCEYDYRSGIDGENEFTIFLREKPGPVGTLREVEITVESLDGAGINNPSFTTEMYYELVGVAE